MYSVVIADDDKSIQRGLAEGSYWKELGFEVLGTFDDGEALLEFLKCVQVDVVLTDIKMTYMGGIEVAKYVCENRIPCKIVFISAYKEFELALQAIQYGVKDYILKPTVEEKIIEVMGRIRKELDERQQDEDLRNQIDAYWRELRPILIEKFASSLIMGGMENKNTVFQRMKFLYPDIDAKSCPCVLVDMEIRGFEQFVSEHKRYEKERLSDALYRFINLYQEGAYFHVLFKSQEMLQMFVIMKEGCNSLEEGEALCGRRIEQFGKSFQGIFGMHVALNIEKVFRNVYEVMDQQSANLQMSVDNYTLYLQQYKIEIMDNVREGTLGQAQNIMRNCLDKVMESDMSYGRNFVQDVFSGIADILDEKNPIETLKMRKYLDYNNVLKLTTANEIILYCERIFDMLKSWEEMYIVTNENNLLNRIMQYVNEHIYEDMCLEDLAKELFVSMRHLRRVFKKHTGKTFLQYITERKMQKARELLQHSEYKVYQVSERLGYQTPRHFAKLFYSHYGYYPSQVRNELIESERDYEGK